MAATADSIILHQYDISPFSEKVRTVLGIKGLEWHACIQPVIMPKPDLVPLTGGYRKIPVMQIGADIYCDSQIIIRELDRRFPKVPLLNASDKAIGYGLGMWTDRSFFQAVVAVLFGGNWQVDEAFVKDREALMGRPFDIQAMRAGVPLMREQLRAHVDTLEQQLADGRPFLLGDRPGLFDVDAYHNIAFIRWGSKEIQSAVNVFPRVLAWEERIKALGHGKRQEIAPADALAIARAATSIEVAKADPGEPNGLKPGDRVGVMADDYGREPIQGEVVTSSAQHIAIRRSDPAVGEVVVHFPRMGFLVTRQG
ncbi:glutathione S-transferase family protein [Zavarzinia sp. CC-PAN008]|uniref:glutathione S-transferase family protein n=1 Tax=Zavarzinia sp. CC-PAN008 TaxID=3243332 RepID=UPI003F744FFF